jgi:hypothetical protein
MNSDIVVYLLYIGTRATWSRLCRAENLHETVLLTAKYLTMKFDYYDNCTNYFSLTFSVLIVHMPLDGGVQVG